MDTFVGTKIIFAEPMTRGAYSDLRNWTLPENENPHEPGYLVVYPDSKQNIKGYPGYVSWSPADNFDRAYINITTGGLPFSMALDAVLTAGAKAQRKGWNGKNMFIFFVPRSHFEVNRPPLLGIYPEGTEIDYHGHIDMRTADGTIVPWLCSQTDMQATDWTLID